MMLTPILAGELSFVNDHFMAKRKQKTIKTASKVTIRQYMRQYVNVEKFQKGFSIGGKKDISWKYGKIQP